MWYVYTAWFLAGVFLVNAIPHFVSGVQGRPFPSPFSSPPGRGESTSTSNVMWGAVNAAIGYLLLFRVGSFDLHRLREVAIVGAGGFLIALLLARNFGGVYGGNQSRPQRPSM